VPTQECPEANKQLSVCRVYETSSSLEIPLVHVAGVSADPDAARGWWHGIKLPGTNVPGVTGQIQDKGKLGRYVNEGRKERIEQSKSGQSDTNTVDGKRSAEILHDDATAAA
jgi:hypothetical protein